MLEASCKMRSRRCRRSVLAIAALAAMPIGCRRAPAEVSGAPTTSPRASGVLDTRTLPIIPVRPTRGTHLFKGCGTAHLRITHYFEATQELFDQGLAQLHGRWYREAERTFRQILAAQPDSAMAHWGVAMACVHDPQRAAIAMEEAIFHRAVVSPREQAYIDALAAFYEIEPEQAKTGHWRRWFKRPENKLAQGNPFRDLDYTDLPPEPERTFRTPLTARSKTLAAAMDEVAAAAPEDLEALAFSIDRHIRNRDAGRPAPEDATLDQRLTKVLTKHPHHPAHLLRMLLWVDRAPSKALASARAVNDIAPQNGNLWFHAGRVFAAAAKRQDSDRLRSEARRSFAHALRADHAHMARHYLMPYDIPHYGRTIAALGALLHANPPDRPHAAALAQLATAMPRHPERNDPTKPTSLAGRAAALRQLAGGATASSSDDLAAWLGGADTIGPARWQPVVPRNFVLPNHRGESVDLSTYRGKPTLVIVYLGFGCLHCVEQLRNLAPLAGAFRKLGIRILAIGPDEQAGLAKSIADIEPSERFDFVMLSDSKMRVFREWLAYDPFAHLGLHGVFLLDRMGRIVFQDLSDEPFDHPDWLLTESKRLLEL